MWNILQVKLRSKGVRTMAYLALYRQWRPQDFDNLIGQDHINITLKNAIAANKVAHAYLFAGPRGTGKTSTAKILAKALNCVDAPTPHPCNVCSSCERVSNGTSMDVFEIDAASNRGIDEIRDLRETVKFVPVEGQKKVYIIDEVHMLTTEAFNALLKTLEEPPQHVVFILATTEPHRIPATIHSRCQRYDFRRISAKVIEGRLDMIAKASGIPITAGAITLIAAHAEGGMRDALSILDQCSSLDLPKIDAEEVQELLGLVGHEWVWKMADALIDRDAAESLTILDNIIAMGKDGRQLLLEMIQYLRSLMLYKASPDIESIQRYSTDKAILADQSERVVHSELVEMIRLLHEGASDARWSPEPRISVEMAVLSICRRGGGEDMAALLERISVLENKLNSIATGALHNKQRPSVVTPEVSPSRQPAERPPNVTTPPVAANGDVKAVWAALLKQLVSEGKRTVHACVSQGQLVSIDDKTATIQFVSQFTKDRTEKDDFRFLLEKMFAQVTGQNLRLQCVLGSSAPSAVKQEGKSLSATQVATPRLDEKPKQDRSALEQAVDMFGGKVVTEE